MNLEDQVLKILKPTIEWVKAVQNLDGGFPSDKEGSYSCTWTSAGLLWGLREYGFSFSEIFMQKGLYWILKHRNEDKGIPIVIKGDSSIVDATAQTAICCYYAYLDTKDNYFYAELEKCVKWLLFEQQGNSGWLWRNFPNETPWVSSTVFAIKALSYSSNVLVDKKNVIIDSYENALKWLKSIQNRDFGWGAQEKSKSEPAVTGLVCSILIEFEHILNIKNAIEYIKANQSTNGGWKDTIDRPGGHTVTRIGTSWCLNAIILKDFKENLSIIESGLSSLLTFFSYNKFNYNNLEIYSWPTRDGLFPLINLAKKLGVCSVSENLTNIGDAKISIQYSFPIIKLNLFTQNDDSINISIIDSEAGEITTNCKALFQFDELTTILKALDLKTFDKEKFTNLQIEHLLIYKLLTNDKLRFKHNYTELIGQLIYNFLFNSQLVSTFQIALNNSLKINQILTIELSFFENEAQLARYPWELLHDGRRFLVANGLVSITRYIAYPELRGNFQLSLPLKILFASCYPSDLDELLIDKEYSYIKRELGDFISKGIVKIDYKKNIKFNKLRDIINNYKYQVLHLDGHGVLAKQCPNCNMLFYPHLNYCESCDIDISDISPLGYFAFVDDYNKSDFVNPFELQNLLYGSSIQMVLLSACQSSSIRAGSIFNSLGPSFIQAGIPAIIAMQLPISPESANIFVIDFYKHFVNYGNVEKAISNCRKSLFRSNDWFIPTLWLRKY